MPATGGEPRPVFAEGAVASFLPAWSPDGARLSFVTGPWRRLDFPDALDVGAVGLDSEGLAAGAGASLVAGAGEDYGASWSPDGQWLAFHSHRGGTDDVYLRSARDAGAEPVALSRFGPGHETGEPDWSPDGRRVVFSSFAPDVATGRRRVFVVPVDPTAGAALDPPEELRLDGFEGDAIGARFSPDGTSVAFAGRLPDGRRGAFVVPAAGGALRLVAASVAGEPYSAPEWSADGRALFVTAGSADGGAYFVERVELDGAERARVTRCRASAMHRRRSPNGQRLAATPWGAGTTYVPLAARPRSRREGEPRPWRRKRPTKS